MRDIQNDKASNKRTLVVILGADMAKLYHLFLVGFGIISFAFFLIQLNQPILLISLLPTIILGIHIRTVLKITSAQQFDPELKKVALSTFGIALLFLILTTTL